MILKNTILFLLLLSSLCGQSQLVRKRDYDAAFAVQAGINTGIAVPGHPGQLKVDGIYGLKMTFPFTRKWFIGAEINYNPLRLETDKTLSLPEQTPVKGKAETEFRSLNVPLYIKYLLRNNQTGILLGGYFSKHLKNKFLFRDTSGAPVTGNEDATEPEKWDAGITLGAEQRLLKHLNLLFKISGSLKSITGTGTGIHPKNSFPLQAHLTISYDILRIGDCGCD